ncbi:hypothetical protein [Candidatus Nitrososphaera gargensis]|uniref:hypothetical protein n=1 Tax=Candidatus Nitrososphaera gargensis TaxID=497727 RepID=UPI001E46563A|nr:hypothetical protein [Candidatus Nitrososphaera gargensis]
MKNAADMEPSRAISSFSKSSAISGNIAATLNQFTAWKILAIMIESDAATSLERKRLAVLSLFFIF